MYSLVSSTFRFNCIIHYGSSNAYPLTAPYPAAHIHDSYRTQGTGLVLRRVRRKNASRPARTPVTRPWKDDIRVSSAHFEEKWRRRPEYAPMHYSHSTDIGSSFSAGSTACDRSRSPSDPGQLMPSPKKKMEVELGMEELGWRRGWLVVLPIHAPNERSIGVISAVFTGRRA
ncbi:hypothetical protein B0H34DRAFT_130522 [Crassisporium funariophilum]|nr:hypothetical protein B0H34DRAFT_130522 [Crassisporium funariophilum]